MFKWDMFNDVYNEAAVQVRSRESLAGCRVWGTALTPYNPLSFSQPNDNLVISRAVHRPVVSMDETASRQQYELKPT